jgi:hypothetical protein
MLGSVAGTNITAGGNVTGSSASLTSGNFIAQRGSQGSWNADFQATPAGTTSYNGDVGANTTNNPGGSWWMQANFRHTNASNYWGTQVAWGWEDNANRLATRNVTGGTFGPWVYYYNTSAPPPSVGVGQTWQNVLPSRAAGTTYTNSTGKPIYVLITCTSGGTTIIGTVDGLTFNTGIGAGSFYNCSTLYLVVPNGSTYRTNSFGAGSQSWLELR